MKLRKIYRLILRYLKPYTYMGKIGVNFPRGGGYIFMEELVGTVSLG